MSDTPETGISLPEFDETKTYRNLPLIVVVGRPNVGKSTLFNRFLHKRRAITDPTPGVTRDPIEEPAFVDGKPVRLMDTGGFKLDRETGSDGAIMDNLVVEKTLGALKKADRILLLLEAGPATPEDEEFIELLRPYSDRLVVAVNKTEGGRREAESWNYLSYGFPELLFISAEHGDNISELAEVLTRTLDFQKWKRVKRKRASASQLWETEYREIDPGEPAHRHKRVHRFQYRRDNPRCCRG